MGEFPAAGSAGLQGGAGGVVIAVVTTLGVMAFDEADHPNWPTELGVAGGVAGGAGFLGAATEQLVVSAGTQFAFRGAATGGGAVLGRAGLQSVGRLGGGAVGAMFVEGISLGLEEREHSGLEVGVRMARSGAMGAGSVWAGAAAGTAIGGPIGFIAGLAIGGILYYVGDKVVPGGRADWDALEAGCPRPQPSATSTREPREHFCFPGPTAVTMADGSTRAIADLVLGDLVLSYEEATGDIGPRRVVGINVGAPERMLELTWADGSPTRATGAHPFATTRGWVRAVDLRCGDELLRLDPSGKLPSAALLAVTRVPADGPVYDLTIEVAHTYVVNGVLVHNKNI